VKTEIKAIRLEQFTITYNVIEFFVAITAGLAAGLVSLVGFGVDSGIETISAVLVLNRLRAEYFRGDVSAEKELRTLKLIGLTFFALAGFLIFESVSRFFSDETPETSSVGLILLSLSVLIMPILAHQKLITGRALNSRLLIADAAETKLCAWMSVSTLLGLILFQVTGWSEFDGIAGLVIAVFAISEGREAWNGELACEDCDCIGKCTC
jgi:divalent metal cation (Fe/Co/Zn/Cd) transporter